MQSGNTQPPLLQTAGADKQFHGRFRVLDIEQVSFIFSLSFFHGMGRTADRRSSPFHSYQKKVTSIRKVKNKHKKSAPVGAEGKDF